MITYVHMLESLAFWRLAIALVSKMPEDLNALTKAKSIPLFFRQVKADTDVAA